MSTAAKLLLLASLTAATLAWPTSSAVAETAVKPAAAPVASQTPEAKTSANAEATTQATSASPDKPTDKSSAQASGSPNDKPSGNPSDKPSVPGEPPVLDPNKFFGHAKSGYAAAQLCPEICAKLFCYCGCDMTDDHDSLLDCFTTDHGVDCHICQEEALIALKMKREGKSMKQIQQAIDIMFEKEYPFDEPTAVIQKYRKNRLWQPGTVKTLDKSGSAAAKSSPTPTGNSAGTSQSASGKPGTTSAKSATSAGKPILGKNGQPVGACCAGHSKEKK
jgi:hypothetical protein